MQFGKDKGVRKKGKGTIDGSPHLVGFTFN